MKILAVIPARYESSRFPGKPLAKIAGVPMIQRVIEQAEKAKCISEVIVATDDSRVFDFVNKSGGNAIMTSSDHQTGTDRIFEAFEQLDLNHIDYVINLQGDEPMIDIDDIRNLNKVGMDNKSDIATLACEIKDKNELNKKNIVKVYTDNKLSSASASKAITFSRENLLNYNSNIYHEIHNLQNPVYSDP